MRARGHRTGSRFRQNYGGGTSKYPWPIPLIARNVATKPELVGHFDPQYPDFELSFPDQMRVEEFLTPLSSEWVAERRQGPGHDAGLRACCACPTITLRARASGHADAEGFGGG